MNVIGPSPVRREQQPRARARRPPAKRGQGPPADAPRLPAARRGAHARAAGRRGARPATPGTGALGKRLGSRRGIFAPTRAYASAVREGAKANEPRGACCAACGDGRHRQHVPQDVRCCQHTQWLERVRAERIFRRPAQQAPQAPEHKVSTLLRCRLGARAGRGRGRAGQGGQRAPTLAPRILKAPRTRLRALCQGRGVFR